MPAHRKPTHLLSISGAIAHDPQRYTNRVNEPVPTAPLGPAPKHFPAALKKIWKELESLAPEGVLASSDRWIVETTCVLMAKIRTTTDFKAADIGHLRACLGSLGMTPADRSRVQAVNESTKQDDPLAFLESREHEAVN